jgi:dihydrofolate synthase/folylpolyglutamate synthase
MIIPKWPVYVGPIKSIDIQNVVKVLDMLGNPQLKMSNVIHVTGTNGKGSTVSYIYSILRHHGFSVNKYTSPHLINYNERIVYNDEEISDDDLSIFIDKVRVVCEQNLIELTMFEATTVAAFLFFAQNKADFNVIEVGMGGLNDATNVFDDNLVCAIITPISLDHTDFLGNNLIDISINKVAITKPSAPCIISKQDPSVEQFLRQYLLNNGTYHKIYQRNFEAFGVIDSHDNEDTEFFCLSDGETNEFFPKPPLEGDHQLINLSAAIVAVKVIAQDLQFSLNSDYISNGIISTKWIGRNQKILDNHLLKILKNGSEIYFDGAHNVDGAEALARYIKKLSSNNSMPNIIIIARSKGSKSDEFVKPFSSIVDCVVTTRCFGEARPESENRIYEQIVSGGLFTKNNCCMSKDLLHALNIIDNLFDKPVRVFICGSLYMARDIFALSKQGINLEYSATIANC